MPSLSTPEAPVREWLDAARSRHSRRSYDGEPLAPELLDELDEFCVNFRPSPVARAVLVRNAPADIFSGIVGSYGRVTGAPSAIAFVGTVGAPGVDMSVGYQGEGVILEATRLGLGTCWIGGFFKAARVADILQLGGGERAFAISPLGAPRDVFSGFEKAVRTVKTIQGTPRKTAEEIAPGFETWLPWARAGIEVARIAPSAVNRQPWRFRYEDGRVICSFDGEESRQGISKRLDCGIAMLHFELGARAAGAAGVWERLDQANDVASFRLT